jgi:hypothetical protein
MFIDVICLTLTQAGGEYGRLVPPHLASAGSPISHRARRRGTLSAFWPRPFENRRATSRWVRSPPRGTDSPSIVPRQAADRDAWLTVARKLRPDLDNAALLEA